jgi:O-antigen/teichoic acid export membrane protein
MLVIGSFLLGLIGTAIVLVMAPYLARWYHNPELKSALFITAAYSLSTIPLMILRPVMLCQGYSLKATLLETIFSIISIGALLIPLLMGTTLNTALSIWIIMSLLRLVVFPIILGDYLKRSGLWWDKRVFKEVWDYLWPIQVGRIPGYITQYLDKVVTSLFFTTQEFAIYSMGAREIPFIGFMGTSVANVLTPYLVDDMQAKNYEQAFRRWRKACERTAIVSYPVAAFCIWYAVPVMQFLFSTSYTESSIPFRVFAALTFVRVIEYSSLAKAIGRTDLIMRLSFVSAVVLFLLIFPLGWFLKGFGIALALLLSIVASFGYVLFKYKKIFNVPISEFFPWQRLTIILMLSLISAALSSFLLGSALMLDKNPGILVLGWKLGVLFIVTCVLYMMLLMATGIIKISSLLPR